MKTQETPSYHPSMQNQVRAITASLFVASGLLLLYAALFTAITSALSIKHGVNPGFVSDLTAVSLGAVLIFGLVFLILRFRSSEHRIEQTVRALTPVKYVLISLIPLSPVIRYLIANREIASLLDIVTVFLAFLGFIVVLTAAIPYLLSRYASGRILLSTANAFCFTILNMASISQTLNWFEEGSTIIQIGLFILAFVVTWILLGLKRNDLTFVILAFIVGGGVIQFLFDEGGQSEPQNKEIVAERSALTTVNSREPVLKPNIYFLVYDSYVPNEVMLNYGIDNNVQESYLVEQGFTLYPKTYSVGSYSLASMNAVLNVSADVDGQSRIGVDGNGVIQKLFRSLDYRTIGIFGTDYFFRGLDNDPGYDFYTPQSQVLSTYELLTTAIWMGEFRFDLGLESIPQLEYASLKREAFINTSMNSADTTFIYSHSILPGHSQNSGVCLPDEIENYADKLKTANEEMTQDISTILASDPDAIIIVAGDHGPYLTKNCTSLGEVYLSTAVDRVDLQDRYGSFLAIRWPSNDYNEYDQITVLQDIFPAILAWMYRDESILDLRIPPVTITDNVTAGVGINNGIIMGGANDGEPLYLVD